MTQAGLRLFETTQSLRPYQEECLAAIAGFMAKGGKRACVVLPTGSGKTRLFAQLPRMVQGKVLILAHREELLDQAKGALLDANPDLSVEIEQADRRASGAAQVVVASIPTLYMNRRRLDALDPHQFGALVVDEAHHLPARSYLTVLAHFGLVPDVEDLSDSQLTKKELSAEVRKRFTDFKPAKEAPFLWGTTATPSRTDGRGLEFIFDELVYQKTMAELIELGFLAKVRGAKVLTKTDISKVRTRAGDFAEEQLAETVDTPERNALAVRSYQDLAEGRRTIVFAASIEHAQNLRNLFHEAGYQAASVFGSTPKDDRRSVLAAFRRGEVKILTNYNVLTEGFDSPECSCIIMARPTQSQLVYQQAIGRGSRIAQGKEDLLVIDLVDVGKLGVVNVNTLFGLPPKLNVSQVDVLTAGKAIQEVAENIPMEMLQNAETIKDVQMAALAFDPLRAAQPEPFLDMRLQWVKTPYGYALGLGGDRGSLGLVVNALGHAEARYKPVEGRARRLGYCYSVQEGIDRAEKWVTTRWEEVGGLLQKGARWHKEPPSPGQLRRLYALKIRQLPGERDLYSQYVAMSRVLGVEVTKLSKEHQVLAAQKLGSYQGRSKGEISQLFNAIKERETFGPDDDLGGPDVP